MMNYFVVNTKKLTGFAFSIVSYIRSHLAVALFAK